MANEKIISELQISGLKDKEAVVYSALLELGGAYPSKIAEYTKLNRSTTYKILIDLSIRGLVNEIEKRNKIYYQIENPKKLIQFSKNKLERAKNQLEYTQKLLPELEGLFSLVPNKPRILFFEGPGALESVYSDHIDTKEQYEMLTYCNVANLVKIFPENLKKIYLKTKEKLNIQTRVIAPDTMQDIKHSELIYKNFNKKIWPKIKFISAEIFPYNIEITIYRKNRVSIINFNKHNLIGVIIEDKDIHGMMRMIFELAWTGATSMPKKSK